MSVIVIVELTAPGSSGWQAEHVAAYGPFPGAGDSRVHRLRKMAEAVHGVASVTVLPLRTAPCCDLHNEHCEPPADLCCVACTEAWHDTFPNPHADGSACVLRA